ncbi:hypothetical protein GGR44_001048 [Sphingobium fontiphilum]|uniref:Uncharacterized protein n=1 Tax=Sphingobium fontiphilum TaxID=944425 RepID=A0A7W6DHH9_9SPHN|nr:hypothetical protein [Sphingobium fontiphilum]MBB3981401.1 hypothetical protein [Sphingobium fontiphilum]
MSLHFDRLRRGERWWAAEIVLRAIGLMLLVGCYRLALVAHRMVTAPPPHQATLGEFAICTAIVVTLTSGLAFTLFGPGLFEEVPIPRNSAYFPGKGPL